ncbi:TonB-dependent receptor [Aquisalimonas asiatica]|uniref:Catecholate siderophore receptor n=1 Tax=Aquisalimonas asiatica TaxID=406100 RepID=A0A1H8S5X0_9GAMM|nr:TonB-dependent siderophore receptor [Aquisalimonas asiatica]SEO73698.1 catecholate siderophore receptor [Aquisalimonas asiatica]
MIYVETDNGEGGSGTHEPTCCKGAGLPALDQSDGGHGTGAWKMPVGVMVGLAVGGAMTGAHADEAESGAEGLGAIDVDFQPERMSSPKYPRDLVDTPRIVTVLPQDLLEEQGVTSVQDAMRNVTGISLQAGEGNPPGGDNLKIRGFNARDDLNTNGVRDLGNYFRDPFYVDQIEVVKGPNSTYGGRGTAGGSVNFVTKQPMPFSRNRVQVSAGTDDLRRATADINQPLDDNSAFRVNLMTHTADMPGRDLGEENRHGIYGAYTWGFQRDTLVTLDYLRQRQDNVPDMGLPGDRETREERGGGTGRIPGGVDFSNSYGHRDDYQRVDVEEVGLAVEHIINRNVQVRNQTRYSAVDIDSVTSSPRIRTTEDGSLDGALGIGDMKPRDQEDRSIVNQTDFIFDFETAGLRHDLVAGFEVGRYSQENRRRPDVSGDLDGQRVDLFNPSTRHRTRPQAPYDRSTNKLEVDELGLYVLDTISFSPQWDLNLGARWDRVEGTASERGHDIGYIDGDGQFQQCSADLSEDGCRENQDDITRTDREFSYMAGVVYKPAPNGSIYASYGTAFETQSSFDRGLVQLAGGGASEVADPETFNVDPERTRTVELGTKWELGEGISVNAAIFQSDKTDAVITDDDEDLILGGRERVRGFDFVASGRITPRINVHASYTFLDSEVRRGDNAFQRGQSLGNTPEHTYSLFGSYDLTPAFTLGGGLYGASSQTSGLQDAPLDELRANGDRTNVEVGGYTVFQAYARYRVDDNLQFRVNADNLTDKDYIQQLASGGAQGIPGPGRSVVGTVRYDF